MILVMIDETIIRTAYKKSFAIIVALCYYSMVFAKGVSSVDTLPSTGLPLDQFSFDNTEYFAESKVTNSTLKGKWSLLYLWNEYCGSCIENMPKLNSWHELYKDKLNMVLVGYTGSQYSRKPHFYSIRKLYEAERIKHNLTMTIAYDSTIFHKYKVYSCPIILVVDPEGVVRGKTTSITKEEIAAFLKGVYPELPQVWTKDEAPYQFSSNRPLFIESNGGAETDYSFRSVLGSWKEYMPSDQMFKISDTLFQVAKVDLSSLYRYAYLGLTTNNLGNPSYTKNYPHPFLRMRDTGLFNPDFRLGKNVFCYSLAGKNLKSDTQALRNTLKAALGLNFRYKVVMKSEVVPCWDLVDIVDKPRKKLLIDSSKFVHYNSVSRLLRDLYLYNSSKHLVLIDKSKRKDKRSFLPEDCDMTNFNEINKWLSESSLQLVPSKRKMKVMVIYDK